MVWTTTNLIAEVKLICMLPDLNGSLSDDDILLLADHAMQDDITPLVISLSKDYWVKNKVLPIEQNTTDYPVPSRAIGQKLHDLTMVSPNNIEYSLPQIAAQDAWRFKIGYPNAVGSGFVYHFAGDNVRILPNPGNSQGSLNLSYFLRRSRFFDEVSGGFCQVVSVNTTTGAITVNVDPTGIFTAGSRIDLTSYDAPNDVIGVSVVVVSSTAAPNVVTVDPNDLPDNLAANDYMFAEDMTIVPGMPADLRTLLVHATAARVLAALADPKVDQAFALVDRDKQRLMDLMAPRNEGEPPTIINYNSLIRGRSNWGWRR